MNCSICSSLVLFVALFGAEVQGAGIRPSMTINIRDGSFDGLECLEPTLSWQDSFSPFEDTDLDYGLEISTDTSKTIRRCLWGKLSFGAGDWDLSTKAETRNFKCADLSLDAECDRAELKLNARAKVGLEKSLIKSISLKKSFSIGGGEVTLQPLLNLDRRTRALSVTFEKDDHIVTLASTDMGNTMRFTREFGKNLLSAIVRGNGRVAIELKRSLGEGNALAARIEPEKDVCVTWIDRGWTTVYNKSLSGDICDTTISKKIRMF